MARDKVIFAALAVLAVAAAGAFINGGSHPLRWIDTDVMSLAKGEERPTLIDPLIGAIQSREMRRLVFHWRDTATTGPEEWENLLLLMKEDPAVEKVNALSFDFLEAPARIVYDHRYLWLLPRWMHLNFPGWEEQFPDQGQLVDRLQSELSQFLNDPSSMGFEDLIVEDPFLLFSDPYQPPIRRADGESGRLAWMAFKEEAPSMDDPGAAFTGFQSRVDSWIALHPGVDLRWTGVPKFASASRESIKREVGRLNILTGVFLVLVIFLFLRDIPLVLRIVFILLASQGTAFLVTVAVFGSIHVLALVMGAVLGGVAVDYVLHLQVVPSGDTRFHRKAVLTSALSTTGGFTLLYLADLEVLQQLGVFIASGILCALLLGLLARSRLHEKKPLHIRSPGPYRTLSPWLSLLILVPCLMGLSRISWKEDIRNLDYPLPGLYAEAASIQEAAIGSADTWRYLVSGESPLEARAHLEELATRFADASGEWQHPGLYFPDFETASTLRERWPAPDDFLPAVRTAVEAEGFYAEAFAPFFRKWTEWSEDGDLPATYEASIRAFQAALPMPFDQSLFISEKGHTGLMVQSPEPLPREALPDHTYPVDPVGALNVMLATYRDHFLFLAGIGILVLCLGVSLVYSKGALAILPIPLAAVGISLGIGTFLFEHFNLFHLVGGYLSLCISVDYALFAWESWRRRRRIPYSVVLSMLTTAGVFAIMGMSAIPAVRALGITVSLVVLASAVLVLTAWPRVIRFSGQPS